MDRNGLYRFRVSSLAIHYIAVFGTRKYFDTDVSYSPHLALVEPVCFRGKASSIRSSSPLLHLNAKVGEFLEMDPV